MGSVPIPILDGTLQPSWCCFHDKCSPLTACHSCSKLKKLRGGQLVEPQAPEPEVVKICKAEKTKDVVTEAIKLSHRRPVCVLWAGSWNMYATSMKIEMARIFKAQPDRASWVIVVIDTKKKGDFFQMFRVVPLVKVYHEGEEVYELQGPHHHKFMEFMGSSDIGKEEPAAQEELRRTNSNLESQLENLKRNEKKRNERAVKASKFTGWQERCDSADQTEVDTQEASTGDDEWHAAEVEVQVDFERLTEEKAVDTQGLYCEEVDVHEELRRREEEIRLLNKQLIAADERSFEQSAAATADVAAVQSLLEASEKELSYSRQTLASTARAFAALEEANARVAELESKVKDSLSVIDKYEKLHDEYKLELQLAEDEINRLSDREAHGAPVEELEGARRCIQYLYTELSNHVCDICKEKKFVSHVGGGYATDVLQRNGRWGSEIRNQILRSVPHEDRDPLHDVTRSETWAHRAEFSERVPSPERHRPHSPSSPAAHSRERLSRTTQELRDMIDGGIGSRGQSPKSQRAKVPTALRDSTGRISFV